MIEGEEERMANGGRFDRRPIPDPTVLTTEALNREIRHMTQLFNTEIKRLDERADTTERARIEHKLDTKQAVDDALTAQKESVADQNASSEKNIAKSEAATMGVIAELRHNQDDVKDRLGKMETLRARTEHSTATIVSYVTLGTIIFGALIALFSFLLSRHI